MMDYDADRHLIGRIGRLQRRWRSILAGAGLCGLAALVVSLFLPKVYRATTYVLVSQSKIGASPQNAPWQFYSLLPTYVTFIDNEALIGQAVQKFHLDQPPYNLTPERFRRRNYLDVRIPKSTSLLELNVEFPDARLAAGLANYLAQGAVEFNDRMNAADTLATQKFLKQQLDQATQHLADTEGRRLAVREKARIEDREKQISILLSEKGQLSTQVRELRQALVENQSKAETLGQALKSEPQTFHLTKSVVADRHLERVMEKLDPDRATPPSMTEETLNTTRQEMERDFVNYKASTAAESAGMQVAATKLEQINAELGRDLAEVALLRSEIEKTDHDYSLAREAVDSASREFRNASVLVSSKSQDLKQVAPALIPERPVRPKVVVNTVVGIFLGFLVFGGLALARESIGDLRRDAARYAEEDDRVGVQRG